MKNAMFTHFTPEPSAYFTRNLSNLSFSSALQNLKSEKQQAENYKNGRERPHFSGFQPPKKFLGSLPPSGTSAGAGSFSPAEKSGIRKHKSRR